MSKNHKIIKWLRDQTDTFNEPHCIYINLEKRDEIIKLIENQAKEIQRLVLYQASVKSVAPYFHQELLLHLNPKVNPSGKVVKASKHNSLFI